MPLKTLAALAALLAAAPLAAQNYIEPGQTVTGTLEEGDPQMDGDEEFYDAYYIRARPGELVEVRMSSEDFDTSLHWGQETGDGWGDETMNDDYGESSDSRLLVRVGNPGTFQLRASSFGVGEEGRYTLQVTARPAPQPVRLQMGQRVEGEITESDHEGLDGREDVYVIRAPNVVATISAESQAIDTYLEFGEWRDGWVDVLSRDDDGGEGTNSLLVAEIEGEVDYAIVVRDLNGELTGPYTLVITEGEPAVSAPRPNGGMSRHDDWPATDSVADYSRMPATAPRISTLETVRGTLDEGSPRDTAETFYEEFTYQARAGEQLRIRLSADDFDAFLQLGTGTEEGFSMLADDDDSGAGLDAELAWTAPAAGEYTIRVTSATANQMGPYVLRILSDR